MQLPTNLLTFLLTFSSFLTLITAAPTAASPVVVVAAAADITYHTSPDNDPNDPNDPAIAFFSSLPPAPLPKRRSPNPSSPSVTGLATKRGNQDYCRGGGYFNATSDGSPWVADCRVIIRNIAPKGGKWHYMTGSQRTLVSHGSCALGIESTDGVPPALQTLVGDLDIAEWIRKSIDLFGTTTKGGEGGKVGSYGDTQCPSTHFEGDEYGMRWGLYRAKGW
ncbi:putative necrosis-inducing factor-domain-containing protein [Pseudoneurospora amorphoporcata]|uniref:Necrosis-inducing factor-domain-containing protein n=1 Tax=Pseudoneurospora amorphoporcata TaxID=241081 RepID=A0AAN6SD76_9PEZI|nr:putative necrosis-inducing factor-domain-containing protein [Pseudoneurospora amorphoporcata]